jgi:hypothetical protein
MSEVTIGSAVYRWEEIVFPDAPSAGWAHHGVGVLEDGTVLFAGADRASLALFDNDRRLRSELETGLTEMHNMTVVQSGEQEAVWIADNGHKFTPHQPRYSDYVRQGRVVLVSLDDGTIQGEILTPEHEAYERDPWCPTAVAVDEQRLGGSGEIWVADGYGKSLLHRFTRDGEHLATFDGSESGVVFNTPHDVVIDRRRATPELYVADRTNGRIAVFGLGGDYLRDVGAGVLTSPSGLATSGDLLFVTELHGRMGVFDGNDEWIGPLGETHQPESEAWPNALDDAGNTVRPPNLFAGQFNSPHGVATDASGTVYVSEWLIGGRLVRLVPS